MKIAILASGEGEKALFLHDFFKEGNRIDIACLLTDSPDSPGARAMRAEGVETIALAGSESQEELVEIFKDRNVELLVIDDYTEELHPKVKNHFGDAVVYLSNKENGPLEVIETVDKLNAYVAPPTVEEKTDSSEEEFTPSEKEWGEALDIDLTPPPYTEEPSSIQQPPEFREQPTPPPYMDENPQQPRFNNPVPPEPFRPESGNMAPLPEQREPMPDTYLIWSVIITILCCLIPGIIAIIYSASVSSKYYAGNIEGAKRASRNAQIWCIISIVAGVLWATLYLPLTLFL